MLESMSCSCCFLSSTSSWSAIFFIYHLLFCNVSFQKRCIKHKINSPFRRQFKLISLLVNCFQHLEVAKIFMFEFGISLDLDMFFAQPGRILDPIITLFDNFIMIKCLQLLWLYRVDFQFFYQVIKFSCILIFRPRFRSQNTIIFEKNSQIVVEESLKGLIIVFACRKLLYTNMAIRSQNTKSSCFNQQYACK